MMEQIIIRTLFSVLGIAIGWLLARSYYLSEDSEDMMYRHLKKEEKLLNEKIKRTNF